MNIFNRASLLFAVPLQIIYAELVYIIRGQLALNNYIRRLSNPKYILKYLGAKIGKDTVIWPGITINIDSRKNFKFLEIGDHVRILWDVIIDINDKVIIKDYAHVGARSSIITHYDLGKTPLGITEYPYESKPVTIGEGVAIAWNCIILHGSNIGNHSIIAVGSVLTGDVPELCVVAGNPARPVKKINPRNPEEFKLN